MLCEVQNSPTTREVFFFFTGLIMSTPEPSQNQMEPLYLLDWLHLLKFICSRPHGGQSARWEMSGPVNAVIYEVLLKSLGLPQSSV